jgi:hypothetical protein
MSKEKIPVVLRYVSRKTWKRSDYADGPILAGGVRGPGWYWALIDEHGKTDDEWWFGPEPTEEMARYVAEQEQGYSIRAESRRV